MEMNILRSAEERLFSHIDKKYTDIFVLLEN